MVRQFPQAKMYLGRDGEPREGCGCLRKERCFGGFVKKEEEEKTS